jgi:hypothetical protein
MIVHVVGDAKALSALVNGVQIVSSDPAAVAV